MTEPIWLSEHITTEDADKILLDFTHKWKPQHDITFTQAYTAYVYERGRPDERGE